MRELRFLISSAEGTEVALMVMRELTPQPVVEQVMVPQTSSPIFRATIKDKVLCVM